MTAVSIELAERPVTPARTAAPGFLRRLVRRPLAVVCLAFLAVLVGVAVLAPILLPDVGSENAGDLLAVRLGPSADHLLGTDGLGRDVLERLLVGTRITLLGVAYALVTTLVLGVPAGVIAGFFGGWTDRATGWLADITFSLPAIVLIVVVLSVFSQSMLAAMITFGVLTAPGLMRVVRAATLSVANELYVAAARVCGMSRGYILTRHILPRIAGPIIVQASLVAAAALLVETGLAFLGLVMAAPQPSWGGMVADGVSVLSLDGWLIWPPGIAIAATVLTLGLLGDTVRDVSTERWSTAPVRARRRRSGRPRSVEPVASDALLSVAGLTVALGPNHVIEDVGFDIARGEIVGIVGESGCGKTMTAMAILGMLPQVASIEGGSVSFAGRELTTLTDRELGEIRGRRIALISQEPMVALDPSFRVGAQLAEAVRRHHGGSRTAVAERVRGLLEDVGLSEEVARAYPHQLSGGMAQRVVIARALAGEPDLLIADEPTTALDVTTQADILELLRTLQADRGLAVLLVTHDLGVVADICQRMLVMYAGQVVERGDVQRVFDTPRHPYTSALLASNPRAGRPGEPLATIAGAVPAPGEWPRGCHFAARCAYATETCQAAPIPMLEDGVRCIHPEEAR